MGRALLATLVRKGAASVIFLNATKLCERSATVCPGSQVCKKKKDEGHTQEINKIR